MHMGAPVPGTASTLASRCPRLGHVIVTRPAADAPAWVARLAHGGWAAEALPLIDIGPVQASADRALLAHSWQHLQDYAACMFVSGNAVEYFFDFYASNTAVFGMDAAQAAIKNIASQALTHRADAGEGTPPLAADPAKLSPHWPTNVRCMAPGPGTVNALLARGVPATDIDAPAAHAGQFDSESLWHAMDGRDWHGRRVLIVRGQSPALGGAGSSGRDWLAQQLRQAGAHVDFVAAYQRRVPQLSAAQKARALAAATDASVWLFSSSEAIANLQACLPDTDWRQARALATHPRIAQAAKDAGWGVVLDARPALEDIEVALRSIESSQP